MCLSKLDNTSQQQTSPDVSNNQNPTKKRNERDVALGQLYKDVDAAVRRTHMLMEGIEINLKELGTPGLLLYSYTFLHRLVVDPLSNEHLVKDQEPQTTDSKFKNSSIKRVRWSDGQLAQEGASLDEVIEEDGPDPCIIHHHMHTLRQYSYNLHIMEHKLRNMSNLCNIYMDDMDPLLPPSQDLQTMMNRLVEARANRNTFFEKYNFEMSTFLSKSPSLTPNRTTKLRFRQLRRQAKRKMMSNSTLNESLSAKRLKENC